MMSAHPVSTSLGFVREWPTPAVIDDAIYAVRLAELTCTELGGAADAMERLSLALDADDYFDLGECAMMLMVQMVSGDWPQGAWFVAERLVKQAESILYGHQKQSILAPFGASIPILEDLLF